MSDDAACTERTRYITQHDLPLSCPTHNERVWDAHPRVYLSIEVGGEVTCPYCNVHYILTDRPIA